MFTLGPRYRCNIEYEHVRNGCAVDIGCEVCSAGEVYIAWEVCTCVKTTWSVRGYIAYV